MEIIQAISSVGFPIVFCLLMFWQNTKVINKNTAAIKELTVMLRK